MDNDINSDGRVVVILGMDRAGTSLCANILNALGMRLGPRLLPGNPHNPPGYFEEEEIYFAHEWILAILERSWDTLTAIHAYPSLWWQSPAMDRCKDLLVDIVRRRRGEGPGVWGFKDPRTAALLPLWNEVFRICEVRPVFVLCVRHPAAVAHSLATRDRFSSLFSELLWFEKTLTGCLAIQDAPHCLIHYEEWFNDPLPQTRMLCKIAGLPPAGRPAALKARVSSIVNSALRHQDGGAIHSPAARDLYALLVQSGEVPDRGVLRHFEFAHEAGRDYITVARHLMDESYLGQSIPLAEHSVLAEDRLRWIHRTQAAERGLHEIKEDGAPWMERCSAAERALGERDTRLREIEEDRARWIERCSGAEHSLSERNTRLREIEEDRARWIERCSVAEHSLGQRDAHLREIEEDRARWMERCSGAEHGLRERDAHLREIAEDRARWMERCSGAEHGLRESDARLREIEEDRARWMERCSAIDQDCHRWQEQFSERDREIAAIRASATWRWTQNALSSWPAKRLLGPFIRAIAGHRNE